ncbi:hypothetical protein GT034_34985 [Streptomyces sp. SID2563]|nr:hypothetical protein [Streptomyces sp. SID2563]
MSARAIRRETSPAGRGRTPLGGGDVVVDGSAHFTAEGAEPPALRRCGVTGSCRGRSGSARRCVPGGRVLC